MMERFEWGQRETGTEYPPISEGQRPGLQSLRRGDGGRVAYLPARIDVRDGDEWVELRSYSMGGHGRDEWTIKVNEWPTGHPKGRVELRLVLESPERGESV